MRKPEPLFIWIAFCVLGIALLAINALQMPVTVFSAQALTNVGIGNLFIPY
ncbi:MAG: hypothetical protein MJ078_01150 [Clostridia bacterium]|nr:hypothetical protein [Clostridia bacterium]